MYVHNTLCAVLLSFPVLIHAFFVLFVWYLLLLFFVVLCLCCIAFAFVVLCSFFRMMQRYFYLLSFLVWCTLLSVAFSVLRKKYTMFLRPFFVVCVHRRKLIVCAHNALFFPQVYSYTIFGR